MKNTDPPVDGANRKWEIKNPMARWSMEVDPPEIPQGGGEKVPVRNVKVEEWKERPMLKKPAELEPGLEFRGFNVESGDKVSVLLRSQIDSNPLARDWVYTDPNESRESACFKVTTALECLIYSFLVMGPEAFSNDEDNKIIGIVKGEGSEAKVCYRNGVAQARRNSVGDACP